MSFTKELVSKTLRGTIYFPSTGDGDWLHWLAQSAQGGGSSQNEKPIEEAFAVHGTCLFRLTVYLCVCLPVYLSVNLSNNLWTYPSTFPSILLYLYIHLSICPPVCLSIYISNDLICPSMYLAG